MTSPLKNRILEDVKQAMRARDRERLAALRLITAAIKQREVDGREALDDTAVLTVLDKMVKQRRESAEQYAAAGREDLAARERFEIEVIRAYLPEPLAPEALEALIEEVLAATGASTMRDMGRVMGALKGRLQGRADMAEVSARVRARLTG